MHFNFLFDTIVKINATSNSITMKFPNLFQKVSLQKQIRNAQRISLFKQCTYMCVCKTHLQTVMKKDKIKFSLHKTKKYEYLKHDTTYRICKFNIIQKKPLQRSHGCLTCMICIQKIWTTNIKGYSVT